MRVYIERERKRVGAKARAREKVERGGRTGDSTLALAYILAQLAISRNSYQEMEMTDKLRSS